MSYFELKPKADENDDVASVNSEESESIVQEKIVDGLIEGDDIESDDEIDDSNDEGDLDDEDELDDDELDDQEDHEEDDEEDDDDMDGGAKYDLEDGEVDELQEIKEAKTKRIKKIPPKTTYKPPVSDSDEENDDEDGESYLQKFNKEVNDNYILNFHPECALQNYDEILSMIKVIRDKNGIIIDSLHRTIPYLTKFEKARILGQRAKQINSGSNAFVKVPENVIDGYLIAELELKEKRIPFIIRRPMPNGGSEYWSIRDLEDISF